MCYFPAAYQGEYVTQAIMSAVPTISYSKLTVQFDSIPIWGVCHRRIGNNVILVDEIPGGGENGNSYSGTRCFKCFNLVLRSANVLQIHTSGLDKVIDFYGILSRLILQSLLVRVQTHCRQNNGDIIFFTTNHIGKAVRSSIFSKGRQKALVL